MTLLAEQTRSHKRFFALPDPSLFLEFRDESPNSYLTLFDPVAGKRTNDLHWNFRTSLLPQGGFLFNRSRTVVAVHNGSDVLLYDSKSLSALNRAPFSNARIRTERMAHAFLSDDCSLLFVEWDEGRSQTNAISIFDQKGAERMMASPGGSWLVDGEKTSEGVMLIFRDAGVGSTILKNEADGKELQAPYLDKTVWDYKMDVIYFLGNLDQFANADRLVSWDYKAQTFRTGVLKL
jgi:hypothetical protein